MFYIDCRAARLFATALLLAALAGIQGCATNPVSGESDFVLMTEEQEIVMGAQAHKEIMKQYREYDNPELQLYVEELGQNLANKSHRNNLDFQFTLLDSPEVNAFALPGGYVYITRGIMSYMNSEEELAGVLGHEIGHVTARHGVRQHGAQTAAGLLGVLAGVATGSGEIVEMSNQLGSALVRGYGRKHELEADRLGAEYLARADYDPEKMLEVVGILKNQEEFELQRAREEGRSPKVYHGVFATHPENDLRLQEVIQAANRYKNPDPLTPNPEHFLRLMDNVTFGDSEDQGILRGHRFYHKDLDFTLELPESWQVDNQPTRLIAVAPNGEEAMVVTLDKLEEGETPAQYLHRQFSKLEKGQELGPQGYTGLTPGDTPFGNVWIRVAGIPHDGRVFLVMGFGRSTRPDQAVVDVAKSIRNLEQDELHLATAKRIRLVRAQSGDTFARLAAEADLGDYAEEELRLLNGMYPDGEPRAGQLIKIIE